MGYERTGAQNAAAHHSIKNASTVFKSETAKNVDIGGRTKNVSTASKSADASNAVENQKRGVTMIDGRGIVKSVVESHGKSVSMASKSTAAMLVDILQNLKKSVCMEGGGEDASTVDNQ